MVRKIFVPILFVLMTLLEVYVLANINLLFFNDISIQLFLSLYVAMIWANKFNTKFHVQLWYNLVFVVVAAFHFTYSDPIIILGYAWLVLVYYVLKLDKMQEEVNLYSFGIILTLFIILKLILIFGFQISHGTFREITLTNVWMEFVEVFINTIITLVFYKIFKKTFKLLYN